MNKFLQFCLIEIAFEVIGDIGSRLARCGRGTEWGRQPDPSSCPPNYSFFLFDVQWDPESGAPHGEDIRYLVRFLLNMHLHGTLLLVLPKVAK